MLSLSKHGTPTALTLSAIAGCGDAAGYLMLGHVYTSHISGNSIDVGVHFATNTVRDALHHLAPIGVFFVGIVLALVLIECIMTRWKERVLPIMLCIEALLIFAFFLAAAHLQTWMLVFPALAFGTQNATLRRAGHYKVRTTYVSGMLTNSAHSFVQAGIAYFKGSRTFARKRRDALFFGSIWLCFALGGVTGAQLEVHFSRFALLAPIGALLILAITDGFLRAD